jgi:predicted nucleic acid-binding protein
MREVLDTRFFIAGLTSEEEQFKKWAKNTFDSFEKKTNIGIVPSIVILEFYKFQLQHFGQEVAKIKVSSVLKSPLKVVNLDCPIAVEAAKLKCKYTDVPTADAIIAATSIKTASNYILTDDNHLKQIKETKTRWFQ